MHAPAGHAPPPPPTLPLPGLCAVLGAEAVLQSLLLPGTANRYFSLCSKEGDGPGQDTAKWSALFAGCYEPARAAAGV